MDDPKKRYVGIRERNNCINLFQTKHDTANMKTPAFKLPRIVETSGTVCLATIGTDGCPSVRAMLNLRNTSLYPHLAPLYAREKNPLAIYLTTNASSAKMGEIRACPKACLYYCDSGRFLGITLKGNIEVVEDAAFKAAAWGPGWEQYYPEGPQSDDFVMLRFTPAAVKSYSDLGVGGRRGVGVMP